MISLRKTFVLSFVLSCSLWGNAQNEASKVVLITLDGLRWQELFTGADSLLITNKEYVHDTTGLKQLFWKATAKERRKALMPFVWTEVVRMGQIHGNRGSGNKVNLTNQMWFSYPGYNEILTGAADDERIDSNAKKNNPNMTVLELVHKTPRYSGKVAAFGSWDVFPFIINEERSGIYVNAGFENATEDLSEREIFLNQLQEQIPSPWGSVRLDAFTHHYALEYMRKAHPDLVYIAYGETDDFAHEGDYEAYLKAAHNTDSMIQELWNFTQKDPYYKNQTVFLVTTDHGRGTYPLETWRSHGAKIKGAGQVWFMAYGNGVLHKGEMQEEAQLYSNQIAPTVAKLLGVGMSNRPLGGRPIKLSFK
ncbi:MAG: sulfatase-like hydrolase/transferase [Flavobacteriaceae bacterium]